MKEGRGKEPQLPPPPDTFQVRVLRENGERELQGGSSAIDLLY